MSGGLPCSEVERVNELQNETSEIRSSAEEVIYHWLI